MAHDVRTPMNSIMIANENLRMTLTDPLCLQMVSLSESASFILMMMFEQVEDLQKIKFGGFRLSPKEVDLRKFLIRIFDKMRIQAEFQSLKMSITIQQQVPKTVCVDYKKLEKVLFSLL